MDHKNVIFAEIDSIEVAFKRSDISPLSPPQIYTIYNWYQVTCGTLNTNYARF